MNEQPAKSILDGIPVDDRAFPLSQGCTSRPHLGVVGSCPACGAPIYGPSSLLKGDVPPITYSCECRKEWAPEDSETRLEHRTK